MPYCTRCGKKLEDGEACTCKKSSFWGGVKEKLCKIIDRNPEKITFLEREKQIIPESVKPDAGEIPIRQYKLARLRSKVRGQYAEGRLQLTNKRLLFRAAGFSSLGKILIQHEFDVNEIAGVEVQKTNKISFLNFIGSVFLSWILSGEVKGWFEKIYINNDSLALLLAIVLFSICVVVFFMTPKMFWLKLAVFTIGIGSLLGSSGFTFSVWDVVLRFELFTVTNILVFILALGWFYILLQVCFVPNLIFSVKTKSASDAVQVRRRVWGVFTKHPQEYSGFSDVLPWEDTEKVAGELGAIINDLQTMGDMAIDKWKD